jgi:integrase
MAMITEFAEGRLARIDAQGDGSAAAAIAAVGTTARDVGLASERGRAVTAVTGTHEDSDLVEEHRGDRRTPLAAWLPTTRLRVAPSTYRGYEQVARAVGTHIGAVALGALTPSDVERMTAAMVGAGSAPGTAGKARKILRLALRQAIRDGLVTRNVAAEARPPKAERYQARTLTGAEARRLLTLTVNDELGPLWAVLVATGLRQGEALGLSWSDIDEAAGRLTVRRSLARGWDGRPALGPVKSERSRRTVALPAVARAALSRQRANQAATRVAAGDVWQDRDDLVFTDTIGRPLVGRYVTPFTMAVHRIVPAGGDYVPRLEGTTAAPAVGISAFWAST